MVLYFYERQKRGVREMDYCIGVDSGGTHMIGRALSLDGQLLAQAEAGPGNIFLNEEETIQNLTNVLNELLGQMKKGHCQYVLLGIAGVETAGNSQVVAELLTQKFDLPVYVISDAKLALLNGLKGEDGSLVIAGTGSVVYGRQEGTFLRFGGWGPLLGDTGSAYKIAENAMKHCLWMHDLGKTSTLTTSLLKKLGCQSLSEAVSVYNKCGRKEIASLAVIVGELGASGNLEAQEILTSEAHHLAKEVLGLIGQYQQPAPKKIALAGSVLLKNKFYQKALIACLKKQEASIEIFPVSTNNANGAIYWSRWK